MKKFMKTAGWQIGAFVLAIGAAFATNVMKDNTMFAVVDGYLPMNTEATICDYKIECNTVGFEVCTWLDPSSDFEHQVFGKELKDGVTRCTKELYKN